ncbi:MAG: hypothetical protein DYG99_10680 [Bacteroidetes bacterium CHB5]|nr:hypothetical protein [Bacteroidetes bacterium CHB5]
MKHVFYVHSGITWLITLGIIREKAIDAADVCVVVGRELPVLVSYKNYVLNEPEQKIADIPSYGDKNVFLKQKILNDLDSKLDQLVGHDDFLLYLPMERNYLMQYLQTHALCAGRNFIEEGLLTYHGSFVKHGTANTTRAKLRYALRFPFHFNRTLVGTNKPRQYDPDNFTVFVCTDIAHEMLQKYSTCKIDLKFLAASFEDPISEGKSLFIFDSVVENRVCEERIFLKCLDDFVCKNLSCRDKVAIKFHPQQRVFDKYLHVFQSNGVPYRLLQNDVIPEVLLMTSSGLNVFGLCSSVLFYAKQWGHSVRTFSPELATESISYGHWVNTSIPAFLINYLRLL